MKWWQQNAKRLFALAFLSGCFAYLGLALSYHREIRPSEAWDVFERISPADGWIEDEASIVLPGLLSRGNRLTLELLHWRPEGIAPAHLKVSVCGELRSEFLVQSDGPQTIFLKGDCEPRRVDFQVLNPFVGSAKDQRKLGAQITQATVSSVVGLPLIDLSLVFAVALAIFLSSLLVWVIAHQLSIPASAVFLAPALWGLLISEAKYLRVDVIYPLWLFSSVVLLGVVFAMWSVKQPGFHAGERIPAHRVDSFDLVSLFALSAVLLGTALRFWGIGFGLPSNFHPDEVPKVNAVMRMVDQQTLDPQYFLHPSLLLYSTYFMNKMLHFFGFGGEFRDSAFLAGRMVSALAGSFSIYFVYVLGRRLISPFTGVGAAFLLAVFPLHVTCSRYLKEDALLTFFVLACAVSVLKAVQEDRKGFLLFGGLLAGLSLSTKYSGLLSVAIVGGAPWLRSGSLVPDRTYLKWTCFSLVAVPLGFVLATPYSVLNSTRFLRDFNHEKSHMSRGHTLSITAWSQYWMYHFQRSIVPGMSHFTAFVASLGVGLLLWRRRMKDLYLLALILLFYLPAEYVKAKPAPQPERYILPCLPFLAICVAGFVDHLRGLRFPWGKSLGSLLLVLSIAVPFWRSIELSNEIDNDTRDQMARWMVENLPKNSSIYYDWKPYGPRFFGGEFEAHYMPRDNIYSALNIDTLRNSGVDYLILSSLWYSRYFDQPRTDRSVRDRIIEVFERVPIVKEFAPQQETYGFHNPTVTLFSLKQEDFAKLESELAAKESGELEFTSNEVRASFAWGKAAGQ